LIGPLPLKSVYSQKDQRNWCHMEGKQQLGSARRRTRSSSRRSSHAAHRLAAADQISKRAKVGSARGEQLTADRPTEKHLEHKAADAPAASSPLSDRALCWEGDTPWTQTKAKLRCASWSSFLLGGQRVRRRTANGDVWCVFGVKWGRMDLLVGRRVGGDG